MSSMIRSRRLPLLCVALLTVLAGLVGLTTTTSSGAVRSAQEFDGITVESGWSTTVGDMTLTAKWVCGGLGAWLTLTMPDESRYIFVRIFHHRRLYTYGEGPPTKSVSVATDLAFDAWIELEVYDVATNELVHDFGAIRVTPTAECPLVGKLRVTNWNTTKLTARNGSVTLGFKTTASLTDLGVRVPGHRGIRWFSSNTFDGPNPYGYKWRVFNVKRGAKATVRYYSRNVDNFGGKTRVMYVGKHTYRRP